MEIAIPLLALGAGYVISNQNSNEMKKYKTREKINEQFTNMGKPANYLPNTNTPAKNYPVPNENSITNTVQKYVNPNTSTDQYFNQTYYENQQGKKGNIIPDVYSLTGDYVSKTDFKHNNMTPFYGAKIKGQIYQENMPETILDNMIGSGSHVIKKIEQAPLFKPEQNVQWTNGAPNSSDFYQSRVNPSMNMSNVKPFDTENVGPGLNQGFNIMGTGGFNSGMEARELWMDKNVDELRVDTNPKLEYSLANHEGPSIARVTNLGIQGKVEKYHPDTFFIQNQDRWLTTTGQEKGQMLRSHQEVNDTARNETTQSYIGTSGAAEKNGSYAPSHYEQSRRIQLETNDVGHSVACNRGTHEDTDNAHKSHTNYSNNRSVTRQPETFGSGFRGAIGSVIAPLMDIFNPTRKEEYVSNIRTYGDGGSRVPKNYVNNSKDLLKTTVKETTLFSPNLFLGNQREGAYKVTDQTPIANQRDTTNCSSIGTVGGASSGWGNRNYDAEYRQNNNEFKEKTVVSRINQGNTNQLNHNMNINIGKNENDIYNSRMFGSVAPLTQQMSLGKEHYGKQNTKQQYINIDRINPDILNAFRSNPYAQSLNSCA
jgi:hypothetical protein